jgi:hypothetical protein
MKGRSKKMAEFLDFGAPGWLDPPRSGEAAFASDSRATKKT